MCGSCTLYIVLFAIFLVTSTIISSAFIYFHWYLKKNITDAYYRYINDKLQKKCDKSCDVGQYLDYKNCKCRKKIIGELVKECRKKY